MCGKYFVAKDIIKNNYFNKIKDQYEQTQLDLWKFNDCYPKDVVLTVDSNRFQLCKWNYNIYKKEVHNSRIESIIEKNMYHQDYLNHKCLTIANGFYEFDAKSNQYYFTNDDEVLYLAGFYQENNIFNNMSIITTSAKQSKLIHSRIPVVLNQQQARDYLLNKISLEQLANINPSFNIEKR